MPTDERGNAVTASGRRPYVLGSGQGESVWSLGGRFTVKVAGADSEGRFSLVEAVAFRTTEPPLDIHHKEDEAWYSVTQDPC
jgi:hypothetical protein